MSTKDITYAAQNLLARREHSQKELQQKLEARGFEFQLVQKVITQLSEQDIQSDARYAEICYRSRAHKGYGPNYIRQYLKQRGISESLIELSEQHCDIDWYDCIRSVWNKKYIGQPRDLKSTNKQKQFLYYRGFNTELISYLFNDL